MTAKRASFMRRSRRFVSSFLPLVLAVSTLSAISVVTAPTASAAQDAECVIGSSSSCPATSPQEIFNLYGTTTDGTYWLRVNGEARQTFLIMNTSAPDGGMWFLGMKAPKGSTTFNNNSLSWTDQNSVTGTTSLSNDVAADAKFHAFNHLPVVKVVAVFRNRDSFNFNSSGSGDLGANNWFTGHTWQETITEQSMFTRFTTNQNLIDQNGNQTTYRTRNTLLRETDSASGKLVFPYQTGWSRYGFNNSTGYSYRWGVTFNNETSMGSNDTGSGIGMSDYSAAAQVSYSDGFTVGPSSSTTSGVSNPGTFVYPSGFQIWGKTPNPSLAAPASLSASIPAAGQVNLSWATFSGATDYVVQYKTAVASSYSNSFLVSGQTTASITGLTSSTSYNFRVFARTATNSTSSANIANSTITATPQTTPSAPSITGITPGNTTLSVAFNPPSTDGGATITNYQYSTDGGSNWRTRDSGTTGSPLVINTTSATTPATLVNGTTYNVQIRAVNSIGSGAATSSTAGTPTFPSCSPSSTSSGGFTILTFTSTTTCNWAVPNGVTSADVLVVGGGGGAGHNSGGGGGGGGVYYQTSVAVSGNATVTVGAGGAAGSASGSGTNGSQSSFGSTTVNGGNAGIGYSTPSGDRPAGKAQSDGGNSVAGSAGASGAGGNGTRTDTAAGSAGSAGPSISITGTATNYAGGGGGGGWTTLTNGGAGGAGGGGAGGGKVGSIVNGTAGNANTGGGGGSGSTSGSTSGAGGSGVVIVRYAMATLTPTFGTPTATADGFTVQISNFNAGYTWSGTATASGSVAVSNTGLVTVTGVAPGTLSTATITNTTASYTGASATVSATSTAGSAFNPTFGTPTVTADGFTVQITNYSGSYTWGGTASASGTVSVSNTGLVTVTGVAANTSSTATITTTRTGYTGGSATVSATSLPTCSPTSVSSGGFTTLTFTNSSSCAWTTPSGISTATVLVVGGGGGGGADGGGGGGGGGVAENNNFSLTANGTYTVTVGQGGSGGNGYKSGATCSGNFLGWSSTAVGCDGATGGSSTLGSISASGGGGGGGIESSGLADSNAAATARGGGGGAGAQNDKTGTGSAGDGGFDGGTVLNGAGNAAGGGASASANGSNGSSTLAGAGAAGVAAALNSIVYGSGGAGGSYNNATAALGGTNAGNGGSQNIGPTTPVANRGGGGGGGGNGTTQNNAIGTAGAAGVVIVRYVNAPSVTLSSNTITGTVNSAITSYTISNSGGAVTSYSIPSADSTAITAVGLSFSTSTGLISGTPSGTLASRSITITATNSNGTSTATFSLAVSLSCAAGGVCVVGDTGPGGGKVFYVAPSGGTFACGQSLSSLCKYLEAAPITGASAWTDARYAWSGNINTAIGTTSTAIGSGYSNTLKMVRQTGAGTSGAGSAARGYRGGGLNDWYLPSKDELNQLYINRTVASASDGYWSSSEATATGAWDQGFGNGAQGVADPGKQQTTPVRPIRAFGSSAVETAIIYVPAVAGVTAPVRSATPVTAVTTANGYTGTVSWSSTPSTFAAATTYTATITLTASSGFTLTGVTANFFTVAGASTVTHSADSGTITAVFPATEGASQTITQTSTSPVSPVVAGTYTPTATASSGLTVAITIASGSSSICSISGGIVTFNAAGSCVIQYNQAGNASYTAATQVTETLTIGKGSQTITFGSLSNRTLGSGTYSISASSSSSLTVAFTTATASICTVASTTITLVAAGTCTINANQAGDSNYLAATQVQQSFTVATAITITTPTTGLSGTFNIAYSLTVSASGGSGSKTFAVTGSLPAGVTISSGGVISGTPSTAGDFDLTVTATDADNATATTSSFRISIAKGVSSISLSVGTYTYTGSGLGPDSVTTSGSQGSVTYAYAGRGSTSYTSSPTKPTAAGTYTVTATLAADSNYASVSASANFEITNAGLVVTPTISASSMTYGTSGGSLPTISYTKNPDISLTTNPTCALYLESDTGFVTVQTLGSTLAAGSYVVRCAGAAATNYTISYGTNPSFTVTKLDITLTVGNPASTPYTGSSVSVTNTFTRTSGTLAGSDAISGMTYTYTSAGGYNSTTAPTAGGNYTITGSNATFSTGSASNYTITYVAGALTITTATQTVTWAPNTNLLTTDSPATPSALATALGSATISYAVTSAGTTGCAVNSSTAVLTFTAAGNCQVTATAAATSNYATASTAVTFAISIPTYVITLAAGTNGSGSNQTLTKTRGADLTLPNSATANGYFTRTGYSVTGWSTTNLGSQTHALGGSFTTEAATTLYPVWTLVSCSPTSSVANGYTIYRFTTVGTCTWTVPNGLTNVEVLAVAGGGGGGYSYGNTGAGGGGGGQVKTGTATLGPTLEVTVGAGGTAGTLSAGRGGSGGNSIVSSITALGGTGGCGVASPSCSVASAATASAAANGGAADQPVTGFSWKRGRGGGGSSTVGGTETGGQGTNSDYSGSLTTYGGGGTGGSKQDSSANIVGATGTANTGNGGGGAATGTSSDSNSSLGANGGAGGSGVVVVRTGNTLNITYDANGGSAPSGGAATTITGGTISSLATTSRTGYTFSGWFTAASGGTQITTSAAHTRSANFTLYAQWSANSLTVTYDSQGGSAVTSGSVNTGANISVAPTAPTRAGYTFSAWSAADGGTAITFPYAHGQTANFTLFALWTANALTVTYDAKGGTTVSDGTVNTAASISTAPTAPTRTGYTLFGWSATDGGTVVTFPYAHGQTANFTLYAKWIALTTNAITYNNQSATTAQVGGSTSYTTDAAIATIPTTAPLRVGYTFAGWFTDPSAGTQVTNGTYTPASPYGSITLYAQWTANSLTVTYNSKGGTTVSNGSVNTAASISSAPTAPTRAGYTFTGWSATDGGTAITFPYAHGQTANFTLYALWTAGSLVVTYNSQGGSAVSSGTAATGASISSAPTAPTRTGYTFDGWSATETGTVVTFPFAHGQTTNFTLYARWSLRVYSVAFNANSGTGTMGNQSFTHGVTTSLNANLYSRANYVFHRWATAADGTGTTYNNFAQAALTAETTLYAQWTANTYVVTFNYNGGDGGDSTATASYTTAGTAITLPVPTKTGFTFAGWHSDAGLTTAIGSGGGSGSYSPTGATLSLNAYAKWTAINYTFTYNSNSADSGTVPTETSKQITQTATVKANTGSLALAGYTFSGWNTASDGTGTNYLSGSLFTVGSSNVTLYAKWSANTYTITYNTNGGTGNAQRSSTNVSSDTYTTGGSSVVFPGIGTLERIGFTFGGWNTSAAGTGTNYSAANTYTTVSNVIFYAKWNPVTYTITYNGNTSNGGSAPTAGGYTTGQASPYEVLANTFTKTSNVFGGWNTAANGTGTSYSPNSSITTLANIVLYATWIPQFTLHYAINGGTVTSGSLPSDTLHNSGASVGPIFGSVSRTGYTFAGWANGSATILGGSNFTILEDSVLTAKWNPINYTISYNSDGGTEAPATSTKQIGQSFIVEAAVSKPGYTFTGWSNGSTVVGADAVVVMGSANIAYTAQWVARVFTVSYDWNGGRGTAEADVNYTFGTTAITLPLVGDRVKDGYTFAGWSESVSGSLLSATYIPSRSRTLYALWTLGNFTVTYNLSGGTLANAAVVVQNGSSTVLPLPTRANFVFDGWHTATAGGSSLGSNGTSFTPTASQTVYARWIQSSLYGITDSLTRIGSVVTVANVGNTFSGANSSSSVAVSVPENALPAGTTINFDMVGNSSRATGLLPNVTYLISIAISWIAGDGTVPDTASGKPISVTISNATIKTGATAYAIVNNVSTLLGTATQDGTITIDLTSDPEIVIAAVKPSAPLNVTATANGNQQSVISWSTPASNGGSEITNYTVTSNTNATCTTSTTSCTISGLANGTGYTFTVTAANSVGTSVASSSASATTAAVYSVAFNSRGGTSVSSGSFLTASSVNEPTAPTRSGYTFVGWSATDGGSVITFPYAPGVTSNITLFARWAALDNAVTFDSKGGSSVTNTVFASGGTLAAPVTPTRSGFTFAGWSATDGGSAISFPYAPGVVTPITLYAKWTPVVSIVVNTTTVIAPVTVTGAKEVKISTAGVFTPISASDLRPLGVKIDENSKKFIAEVKVIEGKLVLTPEVGFSGKKIVTVTINENGVDRVVQIPLTVLPENVTKPVLTPVVGSKSMIRWTASPNATTYTVLLNGKRVCTTNVVSCSVSRVLGPDAEIEVVANGGEGTVSQKVKADFKQTTPVLVARIVSATNTKGTLSDVDTKALEKTIELIKNQGFRTVVISNITTTIKTEGLANERIAKIKSYILAKTGNLKLTFTVVPASSRTYFNNISLK